jgi:hypothetical protein
MNKQVLLGKKTPEIFFVLFIMKQIRNETKNHFLLMLILLILILQKILLTKNRKNPYSLFVLLADFLL